VPLPRQSTALLSGLARKEEPRTRKRINGEGTIYRRRDGRWEAAARLDGRRWRVCAKARPEVARRLVAALQAHHDGLPVADDRQTVATFLASWLASVEAQVRHGTWERYAQLLRTHALPAIGSLALPRLTPQHLQGLYADRLRRGLSPATVVHLHAVLHHALQDATRWGLVVRNVADLVRPPRRIRVEMTTLSPEQAQVLLDAVAEDRLQALYVLAITTGMRQGELLALRWRYVDLPAGRLHVCGSLQRTPAGLVITEPKTASSRRPVALTRLALAALRRHREAQTRERLRAGPAWHDRDLVFPNELGKPLEAGNLLRRSFWPLLKRTGLPHIRFHDLRHTAATLLLGKAVHPKVVAEMLGHSRIAVTLDLYSHVTPTMQQQATEALDALFLA
jgi:integrase